MKPRSCPVAAARATVPLLPAAILLALAPLVSCGREEPTPPAAQRAPVEVRTARVGGAGDGWIEIPGSVEAARSAGLASRFSAVVESVAVEEGDAVRPGQVLVRLDGRDLRARLEGAESALKAARAQRDRVRALFGRDAATRQELDAAEAADSAALAERDAAKAQLDDIEIRAPFAGRVSDKRIGAGDLAVPGQPLLVVQGGGVMRVAASVSREQADRLKIGGSVQAVLEEGEVVEARVTVLNVAGDPASRRFLVKADLPVGSSARAGAFARLRLPRGAEEPMPMAPARALIERGALTGVFVVEEGRARLRWIDTGERAGDAWVVRAGLRAGEEIVLDPGNLKDGDPVQVAP